MSAAQIERTDQHDETRPITGAGQILRHFFVNAKVRLIGVRSLGFLTVFLEAYISAQAGCRPETPVLEHTQKLFRLNNTGYRTKPGSQKFPYSELDTTTDTWSKTKNPEEYLSKNPMRKHGHRRWGLPYS